MGVWKVGGRKSMFFPFFGGPCSSGAAVLAGRGAALGSYSGSYMPTSTSVVQQVWTPRNTILPFCFFCSIRRSLNSFPAAIAL